MYFDNYIESILKIWDWEGCEHICIYTPIIVSKLKKVWIFLRKDDAMLFNLVEIVLRDMLEWGKGDIIGILTISNGPALKKNIRTNSILEDYALN